jgi:hypothetical protein
VSVANSLYGSTPSSITVTTAAASITPSATSYSWPLQQQQQPQEEENDDEEKQQEAAAEEEVAVRPAQVGKRKIIEQKEMMKTKARKSLETTLELDQEEKEKEVGGTEQLPKKCIRR